MAQNGMIEESFICKLFDADTLDPMREQGLTAEMFLTCKDEISFLEKHVAEYKQLPDRKIFLQKFKDFQMLDVTESIDYLGDRIKENFLYTKMVPIVQSAADMLREDSIKTLDYLKTQLENLHKETPVNKNRDGVDIVKTAPERLAAYIKRYEAKGLMGISTGIPQLDEITGGWLKSKDGELVVVAGRPNVGKSWIGEYFGIVGWTQGNTVLHYSGEMSVEMVGFRFDTLYNHFSNTGLLRGSELLGKNPALGEGGTFSKQDYEHYISQLSLKSGYVIVTPDDFSGRKPTVQELETLAKKIGAGMVIIDQLSLMTDQRKADTPRIAYTNISEDAFLMSSRLEIPVILLCQANRESVKNKKKGQSPELHDVAESDGVAQNGTRVLSLSVLEGILKIAIKKNRYGINDKDVMAKWDINTGTLRPLLEKKPPEGEGVTQEDIEAYEYGF